MAVAKLMGIYWPGSVNTFKAHDLPGLEVRTRSEHAYELIVREDDDPDTLFVLVTGKCPEYYVRGFIKGSDAFSRPQWLRDHGGREPAYFIPHASLSPTELLMGCRTEEMALSSGIRRVV